MFECLVVLFFFLMLCGFMSLGDKSPDSMDSKIYNFGIACLKLCAGMFLLLCSLLLLFFCVASFF